MTSRRKFITGAGIGAAATLAAPSVVTAQSPIKWRLQTYSGAALGAHVIKPQIEAFNLDSAVGSRQDLSKLLMLTR